jgi:hypothetical protein
MLVLDAFEDHLTLNARSVIHAMNTGPCGHIWRGDFTTTCLVNKPFERSLETSVFWLALDREPYFLKLG